MFGDVDQTIAAIASPLGGGLRGVVRVSGPQALATLDRVAGLADARSFASIRRTCRLEGNVRLGDHWGDAPASFFVWPLTSYTGQPAVEIHLYGFPVLLDRTIESLCRAGARLAQPGEFTFRAFLSGRLDLTQAEAVLGLIDADGAEAFDVALAQLAGGVAKPIQELRERLLETLAHLEAGLDFVDEDIEFIQRETLLAELRDARERIDALAASLRLRGDAGRTPRVALIGAPNVGKSSLLNALVGRDAAIVSDQAGTTRDWVAAAHAIGGAAIEFVDTAGQSETPLDAIDASSQDASIEQAKQADVRALCFDATRPLTAHERAAFDRRREADLVVWTKCDAAPSESRSFPGLETSVYDLRGIDALRDAAIARALGATTADATMTAATALRCGESFSLARQALDRAETLTAASYDEALVASELRTALAALGSVAGVVYADDLLDRIFSRFCIGK